MKKLLVIMEMSREHGRGIVEGICRYAKQNANWWITLENRSFFEQRPELLKHWDGDGIITRSGSGKINRAVSSLGCPFVELFLDRPCEVESDGGQVGRMAAEHFIERGFYEFAFYAPWSNWWVDWRLKGYREAINEHRGHLTVFPGIRNSGGLYSVQWDNRLLDDLANWLAILPRPCCVYAPNDALAVQILNACKLSDIKIPEEIAVLGNDNSTLLCESTFPPLSSLSLNSIQIGKTAAHLLDCRMNGLEFSEKLPILIPPVEVVTRQSSDIIAVSDPVLADVVHYIRKYAVSGLFVREIVEHFNISSSWLQRQFKKMFGHSVAQEITLTRLKEARELLLHSDFSIEQIARRAGFNSSRYFIQIFRQRFGMTPKEYQKKVGASDVPGWEIAKATARQ